MNKCKLSCYLLMMKMHRLVPEKGLTVVQTVLRSFSGIYQARISKALFCIGRKCWLYSHENTGSLGYGSQ